MFKHILLDCLDGTVSFEILGPKSLQRQFIRIQNWFVLNIFSGHFNILIKQGNNLFYFPLTTTYNVSLIQNCNMKIHFISNYNLFFMEGISQYVQTPGYLHHAELFTTKSNPVDYSRQFNQYLDANSVRIKSLLKVAHTLIFDFSPTLKKI